MHPTLSGFMTGSNANFYGSPTSPSGNTKRSFTSLIRGMAQVGIAAAFIFNIVVPQASAAEPSDRQARMTAAVERIESEVGLERRTKKMADSQIAACYLVRVTDAQRNNGGPDPSIGDRNIPNVLYVRITNCDVANELYERHKLEFERQAKMSLEGPGVDVRQVELKANKLGIDLQAPMTDSKEAFELRDAGNSRIVEALENGTWNEKKSDIEHDGVHLSVAYQPF